MSEQVIARHGAGRPPAAPQIKFRRKFLFFAPADFASRFSCCRLYPAMRISPKGEPVFAPK